MKPRLLLTLFVCALAPALHADPGEPQVALQPAFRAEDFLESIGINGSPIQTRVETEGPFKGAGATFDPQVFFDLGIRYYRLALKYDLTLPDQPQQMLTAWQKSGARGMFLIDHNKQKPTDLVPELLRYDPRVIGEVEGPNEVNNPFPPQQLNIKYDGKTDEAAGAAYSTAIYDSLKAEPRTHSIPFVSYTAIFTDYRNARGYQGFDFGNVHSYQGYDVPSASLLKNFNDFAGVYPAGANLKPLMATECGYNVEADVSNTTLATGNRNAQAKNDPMLLCEYFRHGVRREYLFAIHNADGYGLLESDLKTRRPSYFAVKSLLDEVRDGVWNPQTLRFESPSKKPLNFQPRALLFGMEASPTVHTLVLQKASREYKLLMWNEVTNFDSGSKREIERAPENVTLHFQTPMGAGASVSTQNATGNRDSQAVQIQNGVLRLAVPSSVMIVTLRAQPSNDVSAPALPLNLVAQTTEKSVALNWAPSASPDCKGYFVFREGRFIATTSVPSFTDTSNWVRPGLGYSYAVRAFDGVGNMAAPVEVNAQTPDKRADLIVTDVWSEPRAPKPGDAVRFKARVQNIGDGISQGNLSTGGSWNLQQGGEGRFFCYCGGKPLTPGESIEVTSDGGQNAGVWTAQPGVYTLRFLADDINRITGERDEGNNATERTLVVGEPAPSYIIGSSDPRPGAANLTQEGTLDWVHFGLENKDSINRKANVAPLISVLQPYGDGYLDRQPGHPTSANWSDGTPTREVRDTHTSLWWNGRGHGERFTLPADTTERAARIYVAGLNGGAVLKAHLSDASAPNYVSTVWDGILSPSVYMLDGGWSAVYTLRYKASKPDQKLEVSFEISNEKNSYSAQGQLQAITLR
ncbi:hypothetical protein IAD21_06174 [Abditibacteriota bacterium]|nr:hypothetical protein IAD21_06174 [Abditibacteriota bacterium]